MGYSLTGSLSAVEEPHLANNPPGTRIKGGNHEPEIDFKLIPANMGNDHS